MSKASQQQSMTPRDRAPKAKPTAKGESNGTKASVQEAAKPADKDQEFGVVPMESAEDDFFARGEAAHSSLPPAAMDLIAEQELGDRIELPPLTPAQIERRARLRRIVGGVVGAAAVLTAVVGAKALAALPSSKVTAAEGSLNVPHQVVPSIALAEEPRAEAPKAGAEQAATAEKAAATEKVAAAEPAAPEGTAATAEKPATPEAPAEGAKADEPAANSAAPQARRLPVIDIEIPATNDPAIDQQWASAAKNLSSQDFKGADNAFAELGKRTDPVIRETARLARAAWWTANGRQSEVKPVIADLAANATTPSVRQRARDLLRTN